MKRTTANAPNAEHVDTLLRLVMEGAGLAASLCVTVKKREADDLAEEFAKLGLRAARALGLYE